ncbi:MAG: MBL fold metallo-hydrolase [Bacteroidota bacterium]
MNQTKFGRKPKGERLNKIMQSPNYRNGAFQNRHDTPNLTEGVTYSEVLKGFLFGDKKAVKPIDAIPTKKTDLHTLDLNEAILIWFGHSSYFLQVDRKRILVDPVLSGAASPIAFTTRAFNGSDIYKPEDIPEIDYLFITHDHWDHLDYSTIVKLQPKIKTVICGLGAGEHLEYWGYDTNKIIEKDWDAEFELDAGFKVNTITARHFSGRGFVRNGTLWTSYVLQTPTYKLFLGGDSGYDNHFRETGKKFGPFDLAILENGQYDKSWKYIHMQPNEVLLAAKDLHSKRLFPVHSSKFALANHPWNEPLKRITELNVIDPTPIELLTPMIGEKISLKDPLPKQTNWWEGIN